MGQRLSNSQNAFNGSYANDNNYFHLIVYLPVTLSCTIIDVVLKHQLSSGRMESDPGKVDGARVISLLV